MLKDKYRNSEDFCLLIANYNIYDCEFDSILIKNDAIIAIEYKNYGGKIIATENGEWMSDDNIIKGGSRKTVYQQARVNHAALRNGLRELGINSEWIKDIPTLIVFNQEITLDNQLSGKVKSWLHVTDNNHFIEKIDDITCKSTNISNSEIIDIAIKMNLNQFIVQALSCYGDNKKNDEIGIKNNDTNTSDIKDVLLSYDRFTPNHIFNLRPNQIFVFGTDTKGSQKYGAAGIAAKRFGAQIGVVEGLTGNCYALPTRGFQLSMLSKAIERLILYIKDNPDKIYLITPVGCGHAGFEVSQIAPLFKTLLRNENVMLPEMFIKEYKSELHNTQKEEISPVKNKDKTSDFEINDKISNIRFYIQQNNILYNLITDFEISDQNGTVIAKAEFGIKEEKIIFYPYNSQSEATFRNFGYKIIDPEEYVQLYNKKKS